MKKKVFIFSLCLLLVGCGKKTIDCSKNIITNSNTKVDQQIILNYDNDSIKKETIIIKYSTLNNIDEIKNTLTEQYSNYEGKNGLYTSFDETEEGFNFIIEADIKKIDKNIINELELYTSKYEEAIADLKSNGYICE